MYEITADVPLPEQRVYAKYPFRDMAVGDSFLVKFDEGDEPSLITNRVCVAARAAGKAQIKRFTSRKSNIGVRVWRVE